MDRKRIASAVMSITLPPKPSGRILVQVNADLVDRGRAAYDVLKHLVPAGVGVGEIDVDVVARIAAGV